MEQPLETAPGWRTPDAILDWLPPFVIGLEGLVAVEITRNHGGKTGWLLLALCVSTFALRWRRRASLPVLAATLAMALIVDWGPVATLPMLIAVFTAAEYGDRTRQAIAAAAGAIGIVLAPVLHGVDESAPTIGSRLVAVGLAVALGMYFRTRADHLGGLRDRAARAERERELLAEQAVAAERVRIARELHDVVAHNVSLMVVQAQALAATGGGEAEQQDALGRVAGLGREALSEMHRMLGLLRLQDGELAEREPQPGVRDLEALVARTGEAGLDAALIVTGERRELQPGAELSVYRIVQEALTNVIRHARARHATVTLCYGAHRLELTVADDGAGPPLTDELERPTGHGLVGMRERVALFGGTLDAGPAPAGGYRIHVTLPVS